MRGSEREAKAGRTGEVVFVGDCASVAAPLTDRAGAPQRPRAGTRSDPAPATNRAQGPPVATRRGGASTEGSAMPRPRHPTATIEAMEPMRRRLFTAPLMALAVVLANLLSATFAGGTTAPTLRLLTEPSAGIAPIDALFSGAKRSVDLVVYELADPHLEAILAGDAARGVKVRVLLDRDDEESHNAAAYAYLEAHHVPVRWASDPGIDLTHEKAAVIDNTTALVMTLNLVASDYATTRDFAIVDTERTDVGAVDRVFIADWDGVPVGPVTGADLVWSPGAEAALVSVIDGAHHSLLIENEEMADAYITTPLEAAARRGVRVEIVMTASSSWDSAFSALSEAGVAIRTYASSAMLYIHAKAIVADAGQAEQRAFVGSQNFSIASLVHNRELGIITGNSAIVARVASVINADFTGAVPWRI